MHMEHQRTDKSVHISVDVIFVQIYIHSCNKLIQIPELQISLVKMGKGPKHNNSKPRSNGIFKVAGTNFKDKKGKPKEVNSNLKLVRTDH